jgi:ribonuclease III
LIDLVTVQKSIHYQFRQVKLLETALTHSSLANENVDMEHNERLEFLGDAVLEICVTRQLFERFPHAREGELTKLRARLVSKPTLALVAKELGLDRHLLLGRGEEEQGGRERDSLLANVVEALLGAIFLDQGFDAAVAWVVWVFDGRWPDAVGAEEVRDYKSRLQELTQKLFRKRPVYTLVDSSGPEHEKVFTVRVLLPDGREVLARGGSMKKAEQRVAGMALRLLSPDDPDGGAENEAS